MCTQPCTEYSCWKNTSSSQDNLEFLLLHWSNVQSQVSSASSSVLLHVCMHTHVSYKFEIRHFWMHMVDAQDMESTNVWSRETRYNYGERNRCLFLKGLVPLASTSYTRTHASTPSRPFLHFPPPPLPFSLSLSAWPHLLVPCCWAGTRGIFLRCQGNREGAWAPAWWGWISLQATRSMVLALWSQPPSLIVSFVVRVLVWSHALGDAATFGDQIYCTNCRRDKKWKSSKIKCLKYNGTSFYFCFNNMLLKKIFLYFFWALDSSSMAAFTADSPWGTAHALTLYPRQQTTVWLMGLCCLRFGRAHGVHETTKDYLTCFHGERSTKRTKPLDNLVHKGRGDSYSDHTKTFSVAGWPCFPT